MEQKIKQLTAETIAKIEQAQNGKDLMQIKVAVLGKNGELTAFLRNLKDLPNDQKPLVGKYVNEARQQLEAVFAQASSALEQKELAARLEAEKIDVTINAKTLKRGGIHPINQIRRKVVDFFTSMGFVVTDSPEIETDFYNFEALNIPKDHPAREMQDTFYVIPETIVLRTQTSAGQIRTMEKSEPPIRMINVGRVYRSDDIDATHSPVFHQIEGLVVDKNITMCDLKGMLDRFARYFFGDRTQTRFRPSYFPFTEPSVEVDASCPYCGGKGCRVCKGTGWIEILGAGMVNRNVLSVCNIDPDEYTGFAFGIGLDRITTISYGINDLRLAFENDVRFIKQFR